MKDVEQHALTEKRADILELFSVFAREEIKEEIAERLVCGVMLWVIIYYVLLPFYRIWKNTKQQ